MAPDRRARIAVLYARYHQALSHNVYRHGSPNPAIVEDACSYAWMQLVAQEHVQLDPMPFAWMLTVAKRQAWQLAGRDQPTDPEDLELLSDARGHSSPPADELAEHHERLALVDEIPERPRRFLMRLSVGYSYHDIAAIEGASYSTVNKQVARAKRLLRDLEAPCPASSSIAPRRSTASTR